MSSATRRTSCTLIIGSLCFLSCHRVLGSPERYLQELPAEQELLGEWQVASMSDAEVQAMNGYVALPGRSTVLRLGTGARCTLHRPAQAPAREAEIRCSWDRTLGVAPGADRGSPAVVVTIEAELNSGTTAHHLFVLRDSHGLGLWSFTDSPGTARFLELRKRTGPREGAG
jgi:hypothetical protein